MRIKSITLKNIGPFKDASLDFFDSQDSEQFVSPVTIITGENGTGKTIILDAIRGLLYGLYKKIERNIVRNETDFLLKTEFVLPQNTKPYFDLSKIEYLMATSLNSDKAFDTVKHFPASLRNLPQYSFQNSINQIFSGYNNSTIPFLLVNYWTSKLSTDSFEIKNLVAPDPAHYLQNALSGIQANLEVTQLICFFDYLKSSDNPKEKELGEILFDRIKKIIKLSLIDGEFKYVERQTLTPIIYQTGHEVSLDKLSSGNLYLIQRLVSLLGQMYSVHILHNTPLEELCNTPGLLLIDEAENHLHPKWQKTFLNSILELFPNLQLIVTTHSPFIVSSVKNAKVFVCKSMVDHSIIEDQTEVYSNKPIEDILLSPVFDTNSFNTEISNLLAKRKEAINKSEKQLVEEIEAKLKNINPEYFAFLDIEKMIQSISQ